MFERTYPANDGRSRQARVTSAEKRESACGLGHSAPDLLASSSSQFDPQETLGSGRQASGSNLSAGRRYGNLRQSQRRPMPLAANRAARIHRIGYLQQRV